MSTINLSRSILADISYGSLIQRNELPKEERPKISPQIEQKVDELARACQSSESPPSFIYYLSKLASVDTADPDAVEDFLYDTTVQSEEDLPKPVPIGTHDGVQYFIKSCDQIPPHDASSTAIPPANIGDIYYGASTYEAKSFSTGQIVKMDLKYGIGLGRLYHKTSKAARMEDTEFYVICNVVNKSIWVAFDFEPYTETGDIYRIKPEIGQPYGQLPHDTQNMMIGIMRLFGPEWTARRPLSLKDGDPFGHGTPLACKLVAKKAWKSDVLRAIEAGRTRARASKQRP